MSSSGMLEMGEKVILGGLVLQLAFFGFFMIVGMAFHVKLNRNPSPRSRVTPWRRHMWSLYLVSMCIFVRSVVRFIEYAQGFDGFVISHEAFLYVFDAFLMAFASGAMNWVHPSEVAAYTRGGRYMWKLIIGKRVSHLDITVEG